MILDFNGYIINESSLKKLKRQIHGVLDRSARKRMRKELRGNIVTFKFKKRNGEIRTAHGTLHPDYLPRLRGGSPRPERQMVYYDLDKEGWRSFRSYSFIKILNIKPVVSKTIIPKPKPVVKEDEEEVKKPVYKEKEEDKEEVKKPVHKKEDEDVDEDGKKHAYKSPIYDETKDEKKEREEDDERIEKLKHKDEDVIKNDEDDNDKKKKEQTNESVVNPVEKYPNVTTLGDGEYDGVLWGQCFVYDGHKYYSECGWRNMYPSYCRMIIHGDDAAPKRMDIYQRKELKKLFT